MAWAADLWRSRVSVPILLAGAVFIIALVRLTSLLPERYYFRFSTLVTSERSPFIVEPPGITYARFCNLVRKYNLGEGTFSLSLEGCAKATEQKKAAPEKLYGQKNESAIYRAVFTNDEGVRRGLEDAARMLTLKPLAPADIESAMEGAQSLEDAIARLTAQYQTATQQQFLAVVRQLPDKFASLRALLDALPRDDPPTPEPQPQVQIDDKGRAAFIRAVSVTNTSLISPIADLRLEPISKAKLDELLRFAASRDLLSDQLIGYYVGQIGDRYVAQLTANLKNEGIDTSRDKNMLDRLVRDDAIGTYLVSVAIRLAPVLLFGLGIGLAFGRREITSAAFAAALAAFLLAWPIVLLWDRVVSHPWQDKQPIFYAFYILYVLSFFIVARLAATVGAAIREWLPGITQDGADAAEGTVGVGIVRDLTVAIVVNALFYAGNALIALIG